ncbi:hypothetical protein DAI43_26180 [Achromobacter xylosoxidans]|nr:hypothetical protein DAI43_26180 [Achromobacter xylosoxidans]
MGLLSLPLFTLQATRKPALHNWVRCNGLYKLAKLASAWSQLPNISNFWLVRRRGLGWRWGRRRLTEIQPGKDILNACLLRSAGLSVSLLSSI